MYHEFFVKSPLLLLPVLSLFLFVAIFTMACVRAFSARGRELASIASRIPLEHDELRARKEGRHE